VAVVCSAAAIIGLLVVPALLVWPQAGGDVPAVPSPDSGLTPGAAVLTSRDDVCGVRRPSEAPQVSRGVALTIFRAYGIDDPRPNAYELDYLVSPEIGGTTDVSNLWPQSYSGKWNAHLKDALEDHLRELICSDHVDLQTAQREIATDWIAAYRKYFATDEPVAAHQRFRKDRPWR
jgi:hypothetical protein